MKKLLTGTALLGLLVLVGCGEDEETKQKARIEANEALLTSQQAQIDATIPQIADLTAQLEALQSELETAEGTIAAKNAAEARLAELQAQSAELNAALARIDEFQSRAKLVNPEKGDFLAVRPIYNNGRSTDVRHFIDPAFNVVNYYYDGGHAQVRISDISAAATPRIQACIDTRQCVAPTISKIWGMSSMRRIIDWDAGLVVYLSISDDSYFTMKPFEHYGAHFAERMHAEAEELRAKLVAKAASEGSGG